MHDLVDVRYRELVEPQGWYHFCMDKCDSSISEELDTLTTLVPIHAFVVQVCILGNHLNGKDTHIRSIRLFGPPTPRPTLVHAPGAGAADGVRAMQRYVKQGMRTSAFRRQVERVGHERALSHLLRIMNKTVEQRHGRSGGSQGVSPLPTLR